MGEEGMLGVLSLSPLQALSDFCQLPTRDVYFSVLGTMLVCVCVFDSPSFGMRYKY